jgi:biotin synthase
MFYGDKLLTTSNPQAEKDRALLERLGMRCSTEAELTPSDAAAKVQVCAH